MAGQPLRLGQLHRRNGAHQAIGARACGWIPDRRAHLRLGGLRALVPRCGAGSPRIPGAGDPRPLPCQRFLDDLAHQHRLRRLVGIPARALPIPSRASRMTTEEAPKANESPSPERFDPGERGADLMAAEHYLRYRWAAELAAGKSVLDAGCGTGYGSQILTEAGARRVVGIDVDRDALPKRGRENLEFAVADVHELPYADAEFDLVVSFEVIEHVERRNEVIAELARVLADDGVFLVSSPNRNAYPAGNPHHVYEYLPEELQAEVSSHFSRTALYRQDAWLASTITPRDEARAGERMLAVSELGQARDEHEPYAIVVGTNGQLPSIDEQLLLGHPFEVQWWHDRLQRLH